MVVDCATCHNTEQALTYLLSTFDKCDCWVALFRSKSRRRHSRFKVQHLEEILHLERPMISLQVRNDMF